VKKQIAETGNADVRIHLFDRPSDLIATKEGIIELVTVAVERLLKSTISSTPPRCNLYIN